MASLIHMELTEDQLRQLVALLEDALWHFNEEQDWRELEGPDMAEAWLQEAARVKAANELIHAIKMDHWPLDDWEWQPMPETMLPESLRE